jgi:hypothetical protein
MTSVKVASTHSTVNRLGAALLCLLAAVQALAGCAEMSQEQLKPGDQLTVQSQYTVLGPPQNNQIRVREARTVFFNDQPLTELPVRELVLVQGTNEIQSSITLPPMPRTATTG